MDDQLDNDLKNRIREVFDNFEDGHADEGWLLLREKFPEKAKRRPVAWLWWSSVAAVLLLFLGIFLFKQTPVKQNQVAHNQQKGTKPAPKAIKTTKDSSIQDNIKGDSVINSLKDQNFADNTAHVKAITKKGIHQSGQTQLTTSPDNQQTSIAKNNVPANGVSKEQAIINQSQTQNQSIAAAKVDHTSKQVITNQPQIQDQSVAAARVDHTDKADTGIKSSAKALATTTTPAGINMQEQTKKANKTLFTDDETQKIKKTVPTDKAVRFGIYAATYFNYAKGSSNQMNVGAGFTSDIKLSKNLNLSTGLAIAQNTLSYANEPPIVNNSQFKTSASAPPPASASYFAVASQSIYSAATPTLKNYNANLVGLDVPINLKYEFDPEKSATYVSIGLSSGTFINETYTSSYNYTAPFSANISQLPDQSTHQSFNSFYFAKTLNFSFGTGYSLGRNKLIIEPFVKYPLDGLGSQQLKFGAGGLNLKFNFQTQKK
jgi:hypothetical protein